MPREPQSVGRTCLTEEANEGLKSTMRILYLGYETGTSGHRANALRRLGHEVDVLDLSVFVPRLPLIGAWQRYLGSIGMASLVRTRVLHWLESRSGYDLVWVDGGGFVSRELVEGMKRFTKRVLNYSVDDPYGDRDANYWFHYRRALPAYDLVAVVRKENIEEARSLGARKVLFVYRSADESAHAPIQLTKQDREKWASDVLFVGTAFPERGPFFEDLIKQGVPLSIYGNRWQKLREWKTLSKCWKGPGLDDRFTYAAAIQSAKVCLGLLSKGNRDLHTQRSLEIPSLGGVFCAERTDEHLALYEEDREAVFWDSATECATKCHALLSDETWRLSVAERGRHRYLKNGWTNENVAQMVLKAVFE